MIKNIINLLFHKKIVVKGVFLDNEIVYGKIDNINKCPSLSYSENNFENEIEAFFETFSSDNGQICLTLKNIKYLSLVNKLFISLKFNERKTFFITFDTIDASEIEYIVAIIFSRSFLLHNRNNLYKHSEIIFSNNNDEFDSKMNEYILPELINKLAIIGLKGNSKFNNLDDTNLLNIIKENPEYVSNIYNIIKNRWKIN